MAAYGLKFTSNLCKFDDIINWTVVLNCRSVAVVITYPYRDLGLFKLLKNLWYFLIQGRMQISLTIVLILSY